MGKIHYIYDICGLIEIKRFLLKKIQKIIAQFEPNLTHFQPNAKNKEQRKNHSFSTSKLSF